MMENMSVCSSSRKGRCKLFPFLSGTAFLLFGGGCHRWLFVTRITVCNIAIFRNVHFIITTCILLATLLLLCSSFRFCLLFRFNESNVSFPLGFRSSSSSPTSFEIRLDSNTVSSAKVSSLVLLLCETGGSGASECLLLFAVWR
ncbi:hypothetical protein BJ741DRAFT_628380 [Chytriomyces cf. hyalinus JEL632]|nr:hypothetical protein BJ741DRAFT_628380 [Chytriomyces cf. hyalinus JEL632]